MHACFLAGGAQVQRWSELEREIEARLPAARLSDVVLGAVGGGAGGAAREDRSALEAAHRRQQQEQEGQVQVLRAELQVRVILCVCSSLQSWQGRTPRSS